MTDRLLSRRDVVRLANVPNDALTFWLRSGLIVPREAPAGKGKHHTFNADHVRLARLLGAAREIGLSLDALREFADRVADALAWPSTHHVGHADASKLADITDVLSLSPERRDELIRFYESKNMRAEADYALKEWDGLTARFSKSLIEAAHRLLNKPPEFRNLVMALLFGDGIVALYRSSDGAWVVDGIGQIDSGLPASFAVLFDLKIILGLIDWPSEVDSDG